MSKTKRILIVEDSNIIRLEVKRTLERFPGLEVLELNNAEDLFRFSKRYQQVDLLILDITLGGLDGLSALEQMYKDKEWNSIPVIMLTGRSDKGAVQRALKAGAVNYIRKPFTKEELIERVEKVLGPLEIIQEEIMDFNRLLDNELKRAERGKYSITLLEISSLKSSEQLEKIFEKIKGKLRDIDTIFFKQEIILVILPFTDTEGAIVVTNKLNNWFSQLGINSLQIAAVTTPAGGENKENLLQKLKIKAAPKS